MRTTATRPIPTVQARKDGALHTAQTSLRRLDENSLRHFLGALPARAPRDSGERSPTKRLLLDSRRFLEAGDEARTRDPQLGKLMLYQLSYSRDWAIVARP